MTRKKGASTPIFSILIRYTSRNGRFLLYLYGYKCEHQSSHVVLESSSLASFQHGSYRSR